MLYDVVIGFYSRKNQVGLSHTLVFLVPMELTSSPAQLLRPHLGFRFLLPRRTSIASSSSPSPRFLRMEPYSHRPLPSISSASPPPPGDNGFPAITTSSPIESAGRIGEVKRETKETNVSVKINLDGNGVADSSTGIPFLDHMLDQLASHGLFDVHALLNALGERKGINRFGDFTAPLDEALIHVSLDLSGRPYLGYNLEIPTQRVGTYDTQLVEHFFQSLVNTSGMTLHIRQLAGRNSHHIIEATFKAFARALRQATESDPRRGGTIPSSKGVLSRS
ncbi:PREDICTED: imidazoleglycerol-phosphate dehydratase 2, chloroplastic isoform X2 [Camelina sativa]|uniref:imidazoleglycerol-phosphate dehydratase n=1 Tax=Camelina sativa TaxID=90675 RepID=A0ABM1QQ99_CAMSA|nr:PREDICTED: imidazoleglycerol-phosphate dehydratase 2, chloroplastic isoform X2 [Camelina sativa]